MSSERDPVSDPVPLGVRCTWLAIVLALGVGLDQATKVIARLRLAGAPMTAHLGGTVRLVHAENSGAFLSLGDRMSESARFVVFVVANTALLSFVLAHALRGALSTRIELLSWALVLAGGVGNLIDRAYKGTVTDFVQLRAGPFATGVFNVADVAIMGGVIALLLGGRRRAEPQGRAGTLEAGAST